MKIQVKNKHILLGQKYSAEKAKSVFCPIALAIKEKLGKPVSVGNTTAYMDKKIFILPLSAQKFIEGFDNGETVKPFSFSL